MGRFASGALYLATPLAFAAHPAIAKSGVSTIPIPSEQIEPGAAPARGYVIVTVPPVVHLAGDRSLTAAIDYEVRRRVAGSPTGAASDLFEGEAGAGLPDLDPDRRAGNLSEAVIATHADRIALLRERIDGARSAGADAHVLADLRMRLARAEAARRLAIARTDVERLAGPVCTTERGPGCAVKSMRPAPRMTIRAAPVKAAAAELAVKPKTRVTLRAVSIVTSRPVRPRLAGTVNAHPKPMLAATTRTNIVPLSDAVPTRETSADHLVRARASLAKARALLVADARPVHAAGLLHFPGSETWSLARIA